MKQPMGRTKKHRDGESRTRRPWPPPRRTLHDHTTVLFTTPARALPGHGTSPCCRLAKPQPHFSFRVACGGSTRREAARSIHDGSFQQLRTPRPRSLLFGTLPRAPQHGVRAVPKCLASYVLILSPLPLRVAIPTAERHAVAVASCYTDSERRSTDAPSRRSTQAMRRTRLIRHPCALAVEIRHSEAGGCMSRIAFRRAGPGRWVLGPPVGWGGGRGLLLLHTRAHRHPCVEPRAYYAVFCGTVALLGDSSAAQKTHNHAFQQLVSSSSDQRPEQLGSNVLEL